MNQTNNRIREDWREELKKRLLNGHPMEYFEVVDFIDSLLKSQEHKLREEMIEKIEEYIKWNKGNNPLPTIEEGVARDIIILIKDK